jgi:hypothetical protein
MNPFSLLYTYKKKKIQRVALNYVGGLLPPIQGKYKPYSYHRKDNKIDLLKFIEGL